MDFNDVKAEKASAMQRYNRLRGLAKLFRMAELCVALLLFSWTFARLPFALRISGEYFRKLFHVIVSPLFVFVLCNAIIVSLIAKSGRFSGHNQSSAGDVEAELYEEITKNSSERARSEPKSETPSRATDEEEEEEEVVYHDKQIIAEVSAAASEDEAGFDTDSDPDSDHPRVYRRTQSERFERECSVRPLRRAETEKFRNVARSGEEFPPEKVCAEDKLSDEEFNRTVEDFIAKQLRFRREESLAVVLPNHC